MIDSLDNLSRAVLEYDGERAVAWAGKAIEEEIDPIEVLDLLTATMRKVGDGYGKGELWLPDLIGAASAMKSAMTIVEERVRETGRKRESLGTVIMGTVYGDIHDIGKNMVVALLAAEGFDVVDLGVNVTADNFLEAVRKHDADILAMSALLTVTALEQRKVIGLLGQEELKGRVRVMVGGGALSKQFAEDIGADGYSPTAPGAVGLARSLMGSGG